MVVQILAVKASALYFQFA